MRRHGHSAHCRHCDSLASITVVRLRGPSHQVPARWAPPHQAQSGRHVIQVVPTAATGAVGRMALFAQSSRTERRKLGFEHGAHPQSRRPSRMNRHTPRAAGRVPARMCCGASTEPNRALARHIQSRVADWTPSGLGSHELLSPKHLGALRRNRSKTALPIKQPCRVSRHQLTLSAQLLIEAAYVGCDLLGCGRGRIGPRNDVRDGELCNHALERAHNRLRSPMASDWVQPDRRARLNPSSKCDTQLFDSVRRHAVFQLPWLAEEDGGRWVDGRSSRPSLICSEGRQRRGDPDATACIFQLHRWFHATTRL